MPLHVTMDIPANREAIESAVEGLTALNYDMMRQAGVAGGGFPALYDSGVVYRREKRGQEDWQPATRLLGAGQGDCEDLAAYRAAELRVDGEPATVAIKPTRGGTMYHAVVRRASGAIEDPSRILIDLERTGQLGDDDMRHRPKITLKKVGGHYLGAIDMPIYGGGHIRSAQLGWSPWGALKKAAKAAKSIATNPALRAFIPPQVTAAIATASAISKLSRAGLQKLRKHPQASAAQKRLAEALLKAPPPPAASASSARARVQPEAQEEATEEEYDDEGDADEYEDEVGDVGEEDPAHAFAARVWGGFADQQ